MKKEITKLLVIIFACVLMTLNMIACTEDTDNVVDNNVTSGEINNSGNGVENPEVENTVPNHTHNYVGIVIEPTCTTQGYTTYTCNCGAIYTDNFISAKNHKFSNYISNNDATCFSNATETAVCDNNGCKQTNTRIIPSSMIPHSFVNYVYDNNATCTKDGTETATCIYDGCQETDTKILEGTKLGHSFTNYISNNDATCNKNCTEIATCSNANCDVTDTREIQNSIVQHSFTNYVYDNNATCTKDGTETATCIYDGCQETDTKILEGTKLGHSFTNYISNNDVTVEKDGTKTAICDNNMCTFTDTIIDEGTNKLLAISYAKTIEEEFYTDSYDYVTPIYLEEYLNDVEGFALEIAQYAVKNANIDWGKHVRRHIELQLSYEPEVYLPSWIPMGDVLDILQDEWVDATYYETEFFAIDWIEQGKYFIESLSKYYEDGYIMIFNRRDAFNILFDEVYPDGFSYDELMSMINYSNVDWKKHAIITVNYLWEECNSQDSLSSMTFDEKLDYIREEMFNTYEFTNEEIEYAIEETLH